jgi:bifunctional non-homologous end joining protein LigD
MPRARKNSSVKTSAARLADYDKKRDFEQTTEPGPSAETERDGPLTFVIQKHSARRLHYDFRLEWDGVLKSWSVPRGPSLDPAEKRLAVHVEDHPIEYGTFEGVIPKGSYGAGEVIVWDNGTYSPDEDGLAFDDRAAAEEMMRKAYDSGKISISMRGRKMKGSWTLVKTKTDWLLIKHQDELASTDVDLIEQERSVISGLSLADLQDGRLPDRSRPSQTILSPAVVDGATRRALGRRLKPMLSTLMDRPFTHQDWLFEPKLDGVRAIAVVRDGVTTITSRRGLEVGAQYPALTDELARQPANDVALDGEIVALDQEGRPSFELLQPRLNLTRGSDIRQADASIPVHYVVFDLLHLDGYDLRRTPLHQRKELLARALAPTGRVHLLDHFEAEGELAFQACTEHGMEGVVAKRRDSIYEAGTRSRNWLKIKATQSDEFVIGGYSQGESKRRETFGSLLLGQYEGNDLVFAGNVGSGFTDSALMELKDRLERLRSPESPFSRQPPLKGPTTWVRPELVAEVKFAQRTRDGYLRAPVFVRLRDDKPALEIEQAETVRLDHLAPSDERESEQWDKDDLLDQLTRGKDRFILHAQGEDIPLTNLDKELWPKLGRRRPLTKRDLLIYFARMAPYLLPHLRDRPLTLTRYPNGIKSGHFFQKHWSAPLPTFVEKVELYSSHNEGDQEYLVCNNLPTLIWLGQLADIELHTWYSRTNPEPDGYGLSRTFTSSEEDIDSSLLNYPDFIVIDLDPYMYSGRESKGQEPELNRKAYAKTCQVARWVKDILDSLSLSSFLKTTGKTGLHIYVPIVREITFDEARAACETIGTYILQQHPKDVTMEWSVEKRTGKIFFDHNQNVRGKTLASVYSPRPVPEASVSMPIRWDELDETYPTQFTILNAHERLEQVGELWSDILKSKHDLRALLG